MDPNVFRKGDASSCLVVDKAWKDVINKPAYFDILAKRIVDMLEEAEKDGLITKSDNFQRVKTKINEILLLPLQKEYELSAREKTHTEGYILADAFWDEIKMDDPIYERLHEALERAYAIRQQVLQHSPLTASDKLQDVKDDFNATIIKPLLHINEDEW